MKLKINKVLPSFVIQKLEGRLNLKKVITNTSWLFLERILRMGVALIVGVWVARYLGPHQFGILSYAQAMVALASPIASLGLDNIVVRNIIRNIEDRDKILGTAFMMKLIASTLSIIGVIIITFMLRPSDLVTTTLVAITSIGVILQSVDVIDYWFQSQVQSKFVSISRSTSYIVSSILKIILIVLNADLIYFAVATAVECLVSAILLLVMYKKQKLAVLKWKLDLNIMKDLLKDSWPLILSGMTIIIYMKVDQIMLGNILNDEAVGIFTAATRLSECWYFIPTILMVSFAPTISESFNKRDYINYYKKIQTLMNILASIAIVISIPVTFVAPIVIRILYGDGYTESATVLSIHIWASIFVFLGVARNPYLINENLTKFSFASTALGGIVNIILNMLLIPNYGAIGASFTTLISQAIASYFANALYPKVRTVFKMQTKAIISPFLLIYSYTKQIKESNYVRKT